MEVVELVANSGKPKPWQDLAVSRGGSSRDRTLTLALAGCFVPQHVDLMDAPELLEHLLQLLLVHRAWHLPDEHLDVVRIGLVAYYLLHLLVLTRGHLAGGDHVRPDDDDGRRVVVYHLGIVVVQGMIVIVVAPGAEV
uniref:Uncharacterized protein n=1 Tax=Anopheles farauti TaxID=69004 RepID=A0A182QC39_9DIPT